MKRMTAGLAGLFVLLVTCSVWAQEPKESPWYPLKKDSTWTYKVMGNSITMKVTGFEKVGNDNAAKIETIVNGKSVANEHIVVKDDGVYRVMINGQKPDAPVKFLELPPKAGASWDVATKIQNQDIKGKFTIKQEDVKVPAGEYKKAIVVDGSDFDIAGMKTNIKYWFAEKTGIVKLSFSLGGMDAVLELEKYEPGK